MRSLASILVLGLAASSARAQTADEALSAARQDASSFAELLGRTALPPVLKAAPRSLVTAARAHVGDAPLRHASRVATGDKIAWVETEGGASAKVDSHDAGFLELFAHDRAGSLTDWGELYLFGNRRNVLSAVTYRRVQPQPRGQAPLVSIHEAYRLPTRREAWLVFEGTEPFTRDSLHAHHGKSPFVLALRQAGFQLHDTGPQRSIEGDPRRLAKPTRALLRAHPGVKVVRGPRR